MKLNKHVMAMNLAAVIAFGAVAGIVAPSVTGESVVYAAVSDGDAASNGNAEDKKADDKKADDKKATEDKAAEEKAAAEKAAVEEAFKTAGKEVKVAENDPAAADLKDTKLVSNGDGTATYAAANKEAEKVVIPGSFKDANGNEIKITSIDPKAFEGSKAKSIDASAVALTKLVSKQFAGAKKATSIKINGNQLKAKDISTKFLKGNKKLKKLTVVAKSRQFKKIKSKLQKAAKKTGYKKGTKVKRVSK
ncbi:hypothetical protein [Butyrivibrio sp. LC3010]|uniref:hypothetical protein n=1 Tax=Butyrivibrio sp. LC3010 TaxID=1280680 RepID=UPI00041DB5D2|nr:hypothetical protein [Butyrivibrio sp. LC3010]